MWDFNLSFPHKNTTKTLPIFYCFSGSLLQTVDLNTYLYILITQSHFGSLLHVLFHHLWLLFTTVYPYFFSISLLFAKTPIFSRFKNEANAELLFDMLKRVQQSLLPLLLMLSILWKESTHAQRDTQHFLEVLVVPVNPTPHNWASTSPSQLYWNLWNLTQSMFRFQVSRSTRLIWIWTTNQHHPTFACSQSPQEFGLTSM